MGLKSNGRKKPATPKEPDALNRFPKRGEKVSAEEQEALRQRGKLGGMISGKMRRGHTVEAVVKELDERLPTAFVDPSKQQRRAEVEEFMRKYLVDRKDEMYEMAAAIKNGMGVHNALDVYDMNLEAFYLLLTNSQEFADACGRPKQTFKWDRRKLQIASDLADGYTHSQVAEMNGIDTRTITRYLKTTEFADYIDELIMESGIANRRLRIASMKRITHHLLEVVMQKLDRLNGATLDDESAKGLLSELREYYKLIAQEKNELVTILKSEASVNVQGEMSLLHGIESVQSFIDDIKDDDKRKEAEQAIRAAADDLISRYNQ